MFLWARLVVDYLSTNIFKSCEEVRRAVDLLPVELGELHVDPRLHTIITTSADFRSNTATLASLLSLPPASTKGHVKG